MQKINKRLSVSDYGVRTKQQLSYWGSELSGTCQNRSLLDQLLGVFEWYHTLILGHFWLDKKRF